MSTIVLCIAFAVNASAGPDKNATGFATVDVQKINTEYKSKKAVEGDLNSMQTKYQARLQRRDNMPFLTADEHSQLDTLEEKDAASRSKTENDKIKDLTDKGTKLSQELEGLRQKPEKDLTENDKQRLREAEAAFTKAKQDYATLKEKLEGDIRNYGQTKSETLMKEFRAAVAKVAEQKGLSIVFDNQVALYAGTDITAQVLGELNRK